MSRDNMLDLQQGFQHTRSYKETLDIDIRRAEKKRQNLLESKNNIWISLSHMTSRNLRYGTLIDELEETEFKIKQLNSELGELVEKYNEIR